MVRVSSLRTILFFSALFLIYLLSWVIQENLLFNTDASWLMLASKRLLQGGTYTHDFFEVNPPMILYLFTPAVLLTKVLSVPVFIGLRIYVFLLSLLSLYLCSGLARKIFLAQDDKLRSIFTCALAFMFLVLPIGAFGQREQLFIILAMPYFLLTTYRLQNFATYPPAQSIAIGILAGLGFALKPYFLFSFILVELYYCLHSRRIFAWARLETLSIAGVAIAYLAIIFMFQRDYLTVVLPIITQVYYRKFGIAFSSIASDDLVFFTGFCLLFFGLRYRYMTYKILSTVLALAATGFLFTFLAQQTHWFYHMLPALTMDLLLCVLLFSQLVYEKTISKYEYLSLGIFAGLMLVYLYWHIYYLSISLLFYPYFYFLYFVILFAGLLWIAHDEKNWLRWIASLSIIFGTSGIFYLCGYHSILRTEMFAATTTLLLLMFILCIPNKIPSIKFRYTFLVLFAMLLFAYPFQKMAYVYNFSASAVKYFGPLQRLMHAFPGASIMFFTNSSDYAFPTLDYTHQTFVGRFSAMGWLPDLRFDDSNETYRQAYLEQKPMMDFFIATLVEDIKKNKPDFIFIDNRETNPRTKIGYFGNEQIDYVRFFSLDANFQSTWKMYHLVKIVDGQPSYKFKIYARNEKNLKSPASPQHT